MASSEIENTTLVLSDSVGWVLMLDGNNKGHFRTKGEFLMMRDCGPSGAIRITSMNTISLQLLELKEFKRLKARPFGAEAQWKRMRDAAQERYCPGEPPANCLDFLPSVMQGLLQVYTDGAGVMHKLQTYIRERHIPDLVPGIDDPHQIERAAVHGMRVDTYVNDCIESVWKVVKLFRKAKLLSMQLALDNEASQSSKVIILTCWCEGLHAALSAVLDNYRAMAPLLKEELKSKKGPAWDKVRASWFTTRFVELLAGLIDITKAIKIAEKALQERGITFETRDKIHDRLLGELREPVGTRPVFQEVKSHMKKDVNGATTFKGVTVTNNGSSVDLLRKIKSALIAEMNARFANRGVLKRLAWLDLSRWPEDVAPMNAFVLPDIEAIFGHWKACFSKRAVTLDGLKREFEQIKVVWQTTSKPIEKSHVFWKSIIQNRGVFIQWHYLLRMVLALTPSDAVVEAVFSRLTFILAPQRTLLSTKMVEQLLILAVDTEPWHSYDFMRVVQMLRSNERRAQCRAPCADKGTKKRTYAGKKKKATDTSTGDAGDVLMEESDASVDSGSSSSSSSADGELSE